MFCLQYVIFPGCPCLAACFLRIQKSIFAYISVKQHRNKLTKRGVVGILGGWVLFVFDRCGCTLVLFMLHKSVIKRQVFKRFFTSWAIPQQQGQGIEGLSEKEVSLLSLRNIGA